MEGGRCPGWKIWNCSPASSLVLVHLHSSLDESAQWNTKSRHVKNLLPLRARIVTTGSLTLTNIWTSMTNGVFNRPELSNLTHMSVLSAEVRCTGLCTAGHLPYKTQYICSVRDFKLTPVLLFTIFCSQRNSEYCIEVISNTTITLPFSNQPKRTRCTELLVAHILWGLRTFSGALPAARDQTYSVQYKYKGG